MKDLQLIQSKIYEIHGVRVMLDRDLAALYGTETKVLIQAVKRNIRRFPEDFMFQLTKEEFMFWKSQIVTSNSDKKGLRRPPYAFTEQGVAMISGILHSDAAIETNIMIMRAFVAVRRLITLPDSSDRLLRIESEIRKIKQEMEDILADQNDINEMNRAQLEAISQAMAELQVNPPLRPKMKRIGFYIQEDNNNE